MKPLSDRVAWSAMHDSHERYDPPRCHPETRTAVLDRIDKWATGRSEHPILWLNGPAGAGKSAIAQTLAERWSKTGILGASFFLRRTAAGRNNRERLVPTLTYQFTAHNPRVRAHVKNQLASDPHIWEKSLSTQLDRLIVHALVVPKLDGSRNPGSAVQVIIIDGLDECSTPYGSQSPEEQQKQILEAIALVSQGNPPLRFLIASRPESQIRYSFSHGSLFDLAEQITLSNGPEARADVALFLQCKFADIRRIHPYLPHTWPSPDAIRKLVGNSSGHFVYPATIVRYLSSPRINPEEALRSVLALSASRFERMESEPLLSSGGSEQARPLVELDALYTHILQSSVHNIQSNTFGTLQFLICYSGFSQSRSRMAKAMSTTSSQLYTDLIDLHSLLDVPNNPDSVITFHHASFNEFLSDPRRSGSFWAGGPSLLRVQAAVLNAFRKFYARNFELPLPGDAPITYCLWSGLGTFPVQIFREKAVHKAVLYTAAFLLQFFSVLVSINPLQMSQH